MPLPHANHQGFLQIHTGAQHLETVEKFVDEQLAEPGKFGVPAVEQLLENPVLETDLQKRQVVRIKRMTPFF
jgi:hypothetical protein